MNRASERDPAKFVDILRILNTFYSKKGEEKTFLYQQAAGIAMFKDIYLWSAGFKCLLKKKKLDRENAGKPASTMLSPWRMLQGLQNIIVKKSVEEDQQPVFAHHLGLVGEERVAGPVRVLPVEPELVHGNQL